MTISFQSPDRPFRNDGVLTVENVVTPEQPSAMQEQFRAWVEASREHDAASFFLQQVRDRGAAKQ